MNKYQYLVQKQFLNSEAEVLERLRAVYSRAQKDVNEKIEKLQFNIDGLTDIWEDFSGEDEEKEILKSRIQSKIYQKQYQEVLKKQIDNALKDLQKNSYKTISEYLEKCYEDGFIGTLFDLQGQGVPLIMPIDQEQVIRAVQLDSKISQGLYTRMGEDVITLKKHIMSEVSRGISNGFSFAQVAQQISFKMTGTKYKDGGALSNAMRIARTEGHRIQCQSAMDACHKARDMGADVVKQWDSTLDRKTRESHQHVDGEIRELEEPFSNGLMFPGDPSGGAAEVVNCRCALLQRARWALDDSFTKMDNERKELVEIKAENYNEFKNKYFDEVTKIQKSSRTEDSIDINSGLKTTPKTKKVDISDKNVIIQSEVKSDNLFNDTIKKKTDVDSKTTFHDGSKVFSAEAKKKMYQHERIISGNSYEKAIIYDKEGTILFEKKGDKNHVSFTKAEIKKMKGCVLTHNHPNDSTFSPADINMFRISGLSEIRACTRSGSYVLRQPNVWNEEISDPAKIKEKFWEAMNAAGEKYKDKAAKEGKSILYYLDEMDREGMKLFSERYGLEFEWEAKNV